MSDKLEQLLNEAIDSATHKFDLRGADPRNGSISACLMLMD